jgi:hypothetical protein
MASVVSLRTRFDEDLKRARQLLEAVRLPTYQKALIYELAYLRCFLAWEVFLEETFYAYMLHKPSPNGTVFKRYVAPKNDGHARDIVRGQRRYATWAKGKEVIGRAELFFDQGEPFASGLASASGDLADMVIVRNRIAHQSGTAKTNFLELVRRKHGSVPRGTNAGRFLLGSEPTAGQNRFDEYLSVISAVSRVIAP